MTAYYADDDVTLYLGDCREVLPLLSIDSIDLVLTDPPYSREFQHLYGAMASLSVPLMRSGASLVSLCGHYQVPEVIAAFADAGLRYWWLAGMRHDSLVRLPGKWVTTRWKPAVWFVKDRRRPGDSNTPIDMLDGSQRDKRFHPWGQPENWFAHWIAALCPRSGTVLDPFAGGGSTAVAARLVGCRSVLIEADERYCEAIVRRLAQTVLEVG